MPAVVLTVEELVQTLRRSSLPTIICEGPDDVFIYRQVEQIIGPTKVSVLPAGGRSKLLQIFDRRSEFQQIKSIFFADQDMWLFLGIPQKYADIQFTDGYSIENDVLRGAEVENLLDPAETAQYATALQNVLSWFSFLVQEARAGNFLEIAHIRQVLDRHYALSQSYCAQINYTVPQEVHYNEVAGAYREKLRGKTWLQLLLEFLSHKKRASKYSHHNLLELGCKQWSYELLQRRAGVVRSTLGV